MPVTGTQRVEWIVDGTVGRRSLGLLGRLGGNVWEEFWPDVARHFRKK